MIWLFVVAAVIGIGILLLLEKRRPKASKKYKVETIDRATAQAKWTEIEGMMTLGKPSNFKVAVIEADKLLSRVLAGKGLAGSIGEQLKAGRKYFSDYDGIWYAHKVRNRMVHEVGHDTLAAESRDAIAKFKKAFKDLGIL